MATSLLTTKLNIPPARPQMVPRPRLIERLLEGLNYNLVLVSAPAGFGKTTLISEWAHQNQPRIRTAWVSLDEGDNDPVRFWDYFIAALKTLRPNFGESALALLHSSQPPQIEPFMAVMINELAVVSFEFIFVLDDFHFITSQQIHEGVTYLLEHMPAQMHLVIATRADPPLPIARFRGRGIMLETRTDDLRFTREEAVALFKEMRISGLTDNDIEALDGHTEGWVVGLKMAAISMSGQKDIPGFIAGFTGSQRYVMDYLMEEVLQKQTLEVCEFLLKTSVLERLTVPLCDAVTGRQNSRDILLNLERGHLFIVPLDESRQWYRYEHLFADLLRHQCEINYGTEQLAELHRQASQWYEDNHFPDDAIHHALAAQDWERATRLMQTLSEKLRISGEFVTLLRLFQLIPEALLRENHRLYSQYAATLSATGQFDAAEAALKYLESTAGDDAALLGDVAYSLAAIARYRSDYKRFLDLSEKALILLPATAVGMRSKLILNIGQALYATDLYQESEARLTEAYELAIQAGETWMAVVALNTLGAMTHERGKLERAAEVFKKAITIAGQSPVSCWSLCKLGRVLYEWNDLQAADVNIQKSYALMKLGGIMEGVPIIFFFLSLICLAQSDEARVATLLEEMDKVCQHPTVSPWYHARQAVAHVVVALRQNDLKAASLWGQKLNEYGNMLGFEFKHVPLRLLIAQGQKKEAARLLLDLYQRLITVGAHGLAINVRVYQALAAVSPEEALIFLSEALIKGETMSYVRTFVDEGKLLKPLLEKALSKGITPEYTRKLLTIIEAEERQKLKKKKGEGAPSPYQALLSERELDVLRLIAEGLSNQQIADRLIISLGTTKNHVHSILEKLNVQGRTQAITQARELELI